MSDAVSTTDGPPRGRRRRWRAAAVAGAVALLVGAGAAAAFGLGGTAQSPPGRSSQPPATAQVTRQTLTETETVDGTLGYGGVTPVSSRGSGGVVVTWLPAESAVLTRGQAVYKVDNRPVVLLYGDIPVFQALARGSEGPDVTLLENNLSALGYGGFTIDDEYTDATADAVRDWQEDLGLDQTGVVRPEQVVVAPGQIRVTERKAHVGDLASGPVLTYTGTTRMVSIDLDVAKQQIVHDGVSATVELPDGKQIAATVDRVGTVVTQQTPATGNQKPPTTVEVSLSLADQTALGTLDQAPVRVVLQSERRENVLTVPVNALVALAEGGYGVQVVQDGASRYLAVKTGLFAAGRVEVSGAGLAEGMTVGVPK